jgi:hypothetical protein
LCEILCNGRWANYFLNHDNHGPTKGVPWDYVVPANAITEMTPYANSSAAQW